jgi:hypothetical protein
MPPTSRLRGGLLFPIPAVPERGATTFDRAMRGVAARVGRMYVQGRADTKLVKTGQNWYYSLHA